MYISHDKLSDKTTTKEHYKIWERVEPPSKPYIEMPSTAGDMLFPTTERNFQTTTALFHPPLLNVPRTKLIQRIENQGSISLSGKSNHLI